jgi:hypothetical protein
MPRMKSLRWLFAGCALLALVSSDGFARAGTLLKCEGISTAKGYKYVGTYCVDYACTYVARKMFDEYCPYLLEDGS